MYTPSTDHKYATKHLHLHLLFELSNILFIPRILFNLLRSWRFISLILLFSFSFYILNLITNKIMLSSTLHLTFSDSHANQFKFRCDMNHWHPYPLKNPRPRLLASLWTTAMLELWRDSYCGFGLVCATHPESHTEAQ
ncbi:hypothetical protein EDC01DRAFT_133903 [Geopyxis carbonaria]|nr:hypothetical protein EDC01DRAFT_133903 [Geopyxis carbonaria]